MRATPKLSAAASGSAVRHLVEVPAPAASPMSTGQGRGEQTLLAVVHLTDALERRSIPLEDVRSRFAPHVDEATFGRFAEDIDRCRFDLENVHEIARQLGVGSREDFSSDEEFLAETEAAAADEAAEAVIRLLAEEDRSTSVAVELRSAPRTSGPSTEARRARSRRHVGRELARELRVFERQVRRDQIAEASRSLPWDHDATVPGRHPSTMRAWFALTYVGTSCAITVALAAWVILGGAGLSPDPIGVHRSRASAGTHGSWPGSAALHALDSDRVGSSEDGTLLPEH